MNGVDTLWYHGPIAATFYQTGHVLPLLNIGNNDNVIDFYPDSSELVHAVGMMLLGSDVLSPLINLGWLALALLAAWCIGRRFDVPSIALVVTAAVLATPEIIGDEPGGGYDDIVGVALVLASIALLLRSEFLRTRSASLHGYWIAALAAGLAAGVKYTFLFSALGLTIAFGLMARSGERLRSVVQWCLITVLGGGFWYARNVFYAGNPLPNLHINLGIATLPSPPAAPASDLLRFVLVESDWRRFFLPGLSQAFGPAWWALLGLATAGLITGLLADPRAWFETLARRVQRRRVAPHLLVARILAAVGIATLIGYLVAPEPLLPFNFIYDERFALLAVLCGILVLPVRMSKTRWMVLSLLALFEALLIAAQFATGIWAGPSELVVYHSTPASLCAAIIIFSAGAVTIARRRRASLRVNGLGGWPRKVVIVGSVTVVVVGGFFLQNVYLRHRYDSASAMSIDHWADSVHHARIGVSGAILSYPLYGSDLTNAISFISTDGSWGAHYPITSCPAWREDINQHHYRYVLVIAQIPANKNAPPSPAQWMDGSVARTAFVGLGIDAIGEQRLTVFSVRGRMDPSTCRRR